MLICRLSINALLDEPTILKLPVVYRTVIDRSLLGLLEGRLVYYELFPTVTKYIYRIIVSTSLRHTIFNLIHATPVAGYIGEYKILYQIRLRLFLLRLRSDISGWIKKYPHCMLTYRWRRRETIINVFLACWYSIHYPSCQFVDTRIPYR